VSCFSTGGVSSNDYYLSNETTLTSVSAMTTVSEAGPFFLVKQSDTYHFQEIQIKCFDTYVTENSVYTAVNIIMLMF